jgi:RNA-directed DNA polymerase
MPYRESLSCRLTFIGKARSLDDSSKDLSVHLARPVADAEWTVAGIEAALRASLADPSGRSTQWLAVEIHGASPTPYAPPPGRLAELIRYCPAFDAVVRRVWRQAQPLPIVLDGPQFARLAPFSDLDLPELENPGDLADWLGIDPARLDWYADADGRLARPRHDSLRHYTCTWLPKRSGGSRLIEAPKPRLKRLQRRILHGILDVVPTHPAAFGFVRGRNCLQAAQRHAGEEAVICLDLRDFFVSVPAACVHAIFPTLGYPWQVARVLTGLCTVMTPAEIRADLSDEQCHRSLPSRALAGPHLPQGAPTSPALANLAAWRLDRRLDGLARQIGAAYTRYADDIAISGDRDIAIEGARAILEVIGEIVAEEGFALNTAKTRVQRNGGRQTVTSIVVNRHINIRCTECDCLKAVLRNCSKFGPGGQNRDGHPAFRVHLEGRITWVETVNLRRGEKLRTIFERINWR